VVSQSVPVTVFIPVYNAVAYVGEAVESILRQDFTDFELIVVDDHSTDGSWEAVQPYARDARVRLLRNPCNLSAATSCNIALALARGRYFAFLDADDMAQPWRLSRQLAYLEAHPDITVLGSDIEFFGQDSGVSQLPPGDAQIKANLLPAVSFLANPSVCLRMDFLRARPIACNPAFAVGYDYGFWVDCMLQGARFANLPEPLVRYRSHEAQMSRRHDELRQTSIVVRTRLLHSWFPDLSAEQVRCVEPLLHMMGTQTVDAGAAWDGLVVLNHLLNRDDPSRHGEDREAVRAFLRSRVAVIRAALLEPGRM
jgi:glycosyltransferase involved in cell wall biosynthesis